MIKINVKCSECEKVIPFGSRVYMDVFASSCATTWECPSCGNFSPKHIEVTTEDKVHPLLNPESKHYSMVDDVEAIERMEQMYTTKELMIWANITVMKYRLRIGKKDDVLKEAKKIDTYEAYYKYLEEL